MTRRDAIRSLVLETGGIHKTGICDTLGLGWGNVSHHLTHLSRQDQIILEYHGPRLWAFPPTLDADERAHAALVNVQERRRILAALADRDAATINELSDGLHASRKVIRTHLSHLLTAGVVERRGPRPHRYRLPRDR